MARTIPMWRDRFPRTFEVLAENLPAVEVATPKIWQAFRFASTLDEANASAAVSFGATDPLIWIDEMGVIDGMFDPNAPGRIKINAELTREFEKQPDSPAARTYLCGTVLHELVHWGRFQRGEAEPREMGLEFEQQAYDHHLSRFWGDAGGVADTTVADDILDHGLRPDTTTPVDSTTLTEALPRGIRNNNPGNIKRSSAQWQGLAEFHEMTAFQRRESVFCVFRAPEWGIRAMARILLNYQRLYNLRTVAGMINRWAPPSENDTGAYVQLVAQRLGVAVDEPIDFEDAAVALPMIKPVIRQENGLQPYNDAQLLDGYRLSLA